jgi:hypothetical protein
MSQYMQPLQQGMNAYNEGGLQGLMNAGMNQMGQSGNPMMQGMSNMYNGYNQGGLGGMMGAGMNMASQFMPQSEGPPNPYMSALKNAGMGAYNAYNQGGGMNMGNMMQGAMQGAANTMMQNPQASPYAQMAGNMYNMMQNPQMGYGQQGQQMGKA